MKVNPAFRRKRAAIASVFVASIEKEERDLVVAIYGGGVASATLAQALKGYPHLDVQYYDPALNLTPSSFRALEFDPMVYDALALVNEEAGGSIDRAGWYPEETSIVIVVCDSICFRSKDVQY